MRPHRLLALFALSVVVPTSHASAQDTPGKYDPRTQLTGTLASAGGAYSLQFANQTQPVALDLTKETKEALPDVFAKVPSPQVKVTGEYVGATTFHVKELTGLAPSLKGTLTKVDKVFHLKLASGAVFRLEVTGHAPPLDLDNADPIKQQLDDLAAKNPEVEISGEYHSPHLIDVSGANTQVAYDSTTPRTVFSAGVAMVNRNPRGTSFTISPTSSSPAIAFNVPSPTGAVLDVLNEAVDKVKPVDWTGHSDLPAVDGALIPVWPLIIDSIKIHVPTQSFIGTVTRSPEGQFTLTVAGDPTTQPPVTYRLQGDVDHAAIEKAAGTGATITVTGTLTKGELRMKSASPDAARPLATTPGLVQSPGLR